jgi:hypothetical protein
MLIRWLALLRVPRYTVFPSHSRVPRSALARFWPRNGKGVGVGRYLSARYGQDSIGRWRNLRSFDDFLERRFPGSRRKAYRLYLIAVHKKWLPFVPCLSDEMTRSV